MINLKVYFSFYLIQCLNNNRTILQLYLFYFISFAGNFTIVIVQ